MGGTENGGTRALALRISEIRQRVNQALLRSGNPSREVKLIAVSKTFPIESIINAIEAGLFRFGENHVQEIDSKYEQLKDRVIEWHFIGHLQTNKVKKLLEVPTKCIHSVDRLEVAKELEKQLQKLSQSRDVLVEVNTSGEPSKSGVEPEKALELVRAVSEFETIRVKGLMTIGALTDDPGITRRCFRLLREIYFRLRDEAMDRVQMLELSMGMSGDFEIAVEEGSTMIRIGTGIFGDRAVLTTN